MSALTYHFPCIIRPPMTRVSDKVMIPQEEHPEINFVGLLIGPRGNTLKCKFFVYLFNRNITINPIVIFYQLWKKTLELRL